MFMLIYLFYVFLFKIKSINDTCEIMGYDWMNGILPNGYLL